jgi:hypothetical protein
MLGFKRLNHLMRKRDRSRDENQVQATLSKRFALSELKPTEVTPVPLYFVLVCLYRHRAKWAGWYLEVAPHHFK